MYSECVYNSPLLAITTGLWVAALERCIANIFLCGFSNSVTCNLGALSDLIDTRGSTGIFTEILNCEMLFYILGCDYI